MATSAPIRIDDADAAGHPPPTTPTNAQIRRMGWPLWLITVGTAPSMFFGFHGLAWALPGLVLGARILTHKGTRFPRSAIPLMLLVAWIPLSATVISTSGLPLFTYRYLLFVGCLTSFIWLVNVSEEKVPSERIIDWLAALWITLVVFGYLAVLLPNLITPSPLGLALGPFGRVEFVKSITEWRFAETQGFLGYPVPRPAAPFGGSNGWGSAMGILTPYFVRSWLIGVDRRRRQRGILLLVVAVYPILVSVNRGLWISLAVALAYYAARKALRGRFAALTVLLSAILVVAVLMVATPAGTLVTDRLDNSDRSNNTRSSLYELAWKGALESPLVGHGAPVSSPELPVGTPPVGTHGMLWYLMFIHGFVGLGLFISWLAIEIFRSGRIRTSLGWWSHLSLISALTQLPYYGLLPQVVLIGMGVGLSHREGRRAGP